MKPNYFLIYGIIISLYLVFSGYMNCSSFQSTRDCETNQFDNNCWDRGHRTYPNRYYNNANPYGGNTWGRWYHK